MPHPDEERGVMAAPLPPSVLEKRLVSDQVILDAIHRQILESKSAISSERDLAARRRRRHQPRNPIDVGDARRAIYDALVAVMAPADRWHLHPGDETPVDVRHAMAGRGTTRLSVA